MSHDLPLTTVDCPFSIVLRVTVGLCFCLFGMVCSHPNPLVQIDFYLKHTGFNQQNAHFEQKGDLIQPLLARFICDVVQQVKGVWSREIAVFIYSVCAGISMHISGTHEIT